MSKSSCRPCRPQGVRLWWRAWSPLVARGAAPLCVAGVALGDIDVPFAWQVWHLATSTCVWRGRCGTCCTWLALVARLVSVGRPGRRATLRGRRGTWWHWRSICVAGVALAHMNFRFQWQAWHLVTLTFHLRGKGGACCAWLALVARLVSVGGPGRRATLRGRRGTWWHWRSICVAGVALAHMNFRFQWQAWHLVTVTFNLRGKGGACCAWLALVARLVSVGGPGRRATLRGRRGTWWHWRSICVAGVALAYMNFLFAWQVWHLATSTFILRGMCGACGTGLALTLVARLGAVSRPWRHGTLRGRHLATSTSTLCGRCGTWRHRPSFGMAGVALGDIHAASESISLKYDFVTHTHNFVTHNFSHLSLSHATLSHATLQTRLFHTFAHNIFTHISLTHTTLSHTTVSHTHTTLSHTIFVTHNSFAHIFFTHISLTHNFVTHNFVAHNLSHTSISHATSLSLSHTHLCHTQLCHTHTTLLHTTLSQTTLSHNCVTHNSFAQLFHTHLSHTQLCHPKLCRTQSFTHIYLTCNFSLSHTHLCHAQLCHTQLFYTQPCHRQLCHTTVSHTTLSHTTLYNFATDNLSPTALSHAIFHTQLCHTQSFTHSFVTNNFVTQLCHTQLCHKQLCHTQLFHTQLCHKQLLSHTTLSQTIFHMQPFKQLFHTQLCHTQLFTYNF